MRYVKQEYLQKAKLLAEGEQERLLSRMSGKLPKRLDQKKLTREEAIAIQMEIEDEQLNEWRQRMHELQTKAATKAKKASETKKEPKVKKDSKSKKADTVGNQQDASDTKIVSLKAASTKPAAKKTAVKNSDKAETSSSPAPSGSESKANAASKSTPRKQETPASATNS